MSKVIFLAFIVFKVLNISSKKTLNSFKSGKILIDNETFKSYIKALFQTIYHKSLFLTDLDFKTTQRLHISKQIKNQFKEEVDGKTLTTLVTEVSEYFCFLNKAILFNQPIWSNT